MLVRDVMQSTVTTITTKTTLPEAVRLLRERGIRHLPVVEDGELVGIVSDRDLKRAMASDATTLAGSALAAVLDALAVRDIMTRAVIVAGPDFPVEEAAGMMVRKKISALPVMEGGRLVGIVTETDILQLFVRALGATEPSSRLDVVLDARPSALAEAVRTIEATGASVASVVSLVNRAGFREAVVRVATIRPGPAVRALKANGFRVRNAWPR